MTAFDACYGLSRDIQKIARLHNELETLRTSVADRESTLWRLLKEHERATGDVPAIEMNDVFYTLDNRGDLLIREKVGVYGLKSIEPEATPEGDTSEFHEQTEPTAEIAF